MYKHIGLFVLILLASALACGSVVSEPEGTDEIVEDAEPTIIQVKEAGPTNLPTNSSEFITTDIPINTPMPSPTLNSLKDAMFVPSNYVFQDTYLYPQPAFPDSAKDGLVDFLMKTFVDESGVELPATGHVQIMLYTDEDAALNAYNSWITYDILESTRSRSFEDDYGEPITLNVTDIRVEVAEIDSVFNYITTRYVSKRCRSVYTYLHINSTMEDATSSELLSSDIWASVLQSTSEALSDIACD